MYRGSRKHVLDWTGQPSISDDLKSLLSPTPVLFTEPITIMPRGKDLPKEARLGSFGPDWLSNTDIWRELRDWWLVHKVGANTPNWDIAAP